MKYHIILGLIIVSLVLIGCSANNADTVEPTPVIVEEPVEVPVEDSLADKPVELEPFVIEITAVPDPKEANVKVGQEVVFKNVYTIAYRIIGDKQDFFKTEPIPPGEVFIKTYSEPGEYQYVLVPGTAGKVIVTE